MWTFWSIYLRINHSRRFSLLAAFNNRIGFKGYLARDIATVILQQKRLKRIPDTALPIDQRAIAIHGENFVLIEIICHKEIPLRC